MEPRSPAWSSDGKRIAFAGARNIFTVDVASGKLIRLTRSTKPWLGNYTPAYSPDGNRIAFSRNTDAFNSDIFVMSATGKSLRRLTRSQGTDGRLGEERERSAFQRGRQAASLYTRRTRRDDQRGRHRRTRARARRLG